LIGACTYLFSSKVPDKNSMVCSSDAWRCVHILTDNGGATTSFFNRIYLFDSKTKFKTLLFSVDKVLPIQIKISWDSLNKISVTIPSCSLVERVSSVNNFKIDFKEGAGANVINNCTIEK